MKDFEKTWMIFDFNDVKDLLVSYFVVRFRSEEIQLAGTDEAPGTIFRHRVTMGHRALVGMRAQVLKPRQRFWVPTSAWRWPCCGCWLMKNGGNVVEKTMISMRP